MADVTFPAAVLDGSLVQGHEVRASKIIYVQVACEKLRLLHNAGWKWVRIGEGSGETLSPQEGALFQEQFPGQWHGSLAS